MQADQFVDGFVAAVLVGDGGVFVDRLVQQVVIGMGGGDRLFNYCNRLWIVCARRNIRRNICRTSHRHTEGRICTRLCRQRLDHSVRRWSVRTR